MRRVVLLVIFSLFLCVSGLQAQEGLVTDLSESRIEIRYSFEGADLILFGTAGQAVPGGASYDVVVVVRGPEVPTVVRRKDKLGAIWVNRDSLTFLAAPGYYAVAASKPLAEVADELTLAQVGIGFENLRLAIDGGPPAEAKRPDYMTALARIKTANGLYRQELDSVRLLGAGLFRTNVRLPANVPVGEFFVDAFVFQEGQLVTSNRISLIVDKEGFERAVYTFAQAWPFFYGLVAVIIALLSGWGASFVGRRG